MHHAANNLRIIVNNLTICYNDDGHIGDPVVIFIHGFPLNKSMWNKQLVAFQDNHRIIAYDIRGHGNSDPGKEPFSIELFVNDLLGMMDALEIEKAVLCGLSMGGYIALNAVINHPERFIALILSDTSCKADTPEAKEKRMKTIANIKENGVEQYADESIKNLFAPGSFVTKKEEISSVRRMIVNTSEQSIINTLQALAARVETCSKLPDIKVPVLIIVGKEDKLTPPEAAKFMHESIKGASLCVLENAGHLSNLENPDQFNDQLKRFVKSL